MNKTCIHSSGCTKPVRARGLCETHYRQVVRAERLANPYPTGSEIRSLRKAAGMPHSVLADTMGIGRASFCKIEDGTHWVSEYQLSEIKEVISAYCAPDPEEWFWNRVDRSGGIESCWPWIGNIDTKGYGDLYLGAFKASAFTGEKIATLRAPSEKARKHRAHRVAWQLVHGFILEEIQVLHHCDNRPCCNPFGDNHLFNGSHVDNMLDMAIKERTNPSQVTADDVRLIRALYSIGNISQDKLAKQYNIDQTAISSIIRRRTWRHVD